MSCLFCKIVEGSIPSKAIHQDELSYAFADIDPKAPVHVLVVPREHIAALSEAGESSKALLGHLMWVAAEVACELNLGAGYRVVVNNGKNGGQAVDHLHLHVLGGRQMAWPPG